MAQASKLGHASACLECFRVRIHGRLPSQREFSSAALLNSLPKTYLVTVSIAEMQPMCVELSEKVRASLSAVQGEVRAILEQIR